MIIIIIWSWIDEPSETTTLGVAHGMFISYCSSARYMFHLLPSSSTLLMYTTHILRDNLIIYTHHRISIATSVRYADNARRRVCTMPLPDLHINLASLVLASSCSYSSSAVLLSCDIIIIMRRKERERKSERGRERERKRRRQRGVAWRITEERRERKDMNIQQKIYRRLT